MKNIKQLPAIILFTTTLLISGSCNKDFLEKNPLDQISGGTFWKTESDLNMALGGCYSRLRNGFLGWNRAYLDCLSDNAFANWNYFNMPAMTLGAVSSTTGGAITSLYNNSYLGISSCNYFLDNVDKVTTVDEAKRNQMKAEARFLRALMYFDLVNSFGGVPIYDHLPENADASKIPKSTKEQVMQFIHDDLSFAIANLPDVPYNGNAVKGSAMGLQAKAYLFEEKWQEAADMAKQVMDAGVFRLADNYEQLFLTAGQQDNPEIMFSTRYLSPNSYHGDFAGADIEYGWGSHVCPYQNLADAYECTDGKPISESPLYNPTDPTQNRDPRLAFTLKLPQVSWPGGEPNGAPSQTGINMQKYVDLSRIPWNYSKANLTDQDMVHLRYADVLLMYAEAKNEVSGPSADVYAALDEVRGRTSVGMPPVDQATYNTKEKLRDYIRHERRVEMAMEGHRYFDIKRWRIAHLVMPQITNPAGLPLKFEETHYLLPFQQSELDNNPELEQNPGY